jgi:hypothetical protein
LQNAEVVVKDHPLFDKIYVVNLLNNFNGDIEFVKKALIEDEMGTF